MGYSIIEGMEKISVGDAARLLKTTYWAGHRSAEVIEKSMRNSSCYGIWSEEDQRLVAFARVLSDFATTWYLCDVVIDPEYRFQGLGKKLVSHIASLPAYTGLRGILLTRDPHGLYEQLGFEPVNGRAIVPPPVQP